MVFIADKTSRSTSTIPGQLLPGHLASGRLGCISLLDRATPRVCAESTTWRLTLRQRERRCVGLDARYWCSRVRCKRLRLPDERELFDGDCRGTTPVVVQGCSRRARVLGVERSIVCIQHPQQPQAGGLRFPGGGHGPRHYRGIGSRCGVRPDPGGRPERAADHAERNPGGLGGRRDVALRRGAGRS